MTFLFITRLFALVKCSSSVASYEEINYLVCYRIFGKNCSLRHYIPCFFAIVHSLRCNRKAKDHLAHQVELMLNRRNPGLPKNKARTKAENAWVGARLEQFHFDPHLADTQHPLLEQGKEEETETSPSAQCKKKPAFGK
jgi:hypothetical protein